MLNKFALMWLELAADEPEDDGVDVDSSAEGAEVDDGAEDSDEDESGDTDEETISEFDIDGEKLTIEQIRELRKNGMRQSDYTRKTQELAKFRKENNDAIELYDFIRNNPELAQKLDEYARELGTGKTPEITDPRIQDIQVELFSIKLDSQIKAIKAADSDVDEMELLQICADKGIDAEEAYDIWRGKNFDKILAKKLSQKSSEITNNIKKNGVETRTLISNNKIKNDSTYGLSKEEIVMAEKLNMTPEEYAKWR